MVDGITKVKLKLNIKESFWVKARGPLTDTYLCTQGKLEFMTFGVKPILSTTRASAHGHIDFFANSKVSYFYVHMDRYFMMYPHGFALI